MNQENLPTPEQQISPEPSSEARVGKTEAEIAQQIGRITNKLIERAEPLGLPDGMGGGLSFQSAEQPDALVHADELRLRDGESVLNTYTVSRQASPNQLMQRNAGDVTLVSLEPGKLADSKAMTMVFAESGKQVRGHKSDFSAEHSSDSHNTTEKNVEAAAKTLAKIRSEVAKAEEKTRQ